MAILDSPDYFFKKTMLLCLVSISAVMLVSLLPLLPSLTYLGCLSSGLFLAGCILYVRLPRYRLWVVYGLVFLLVAGWCIVWGQAQIDKRLPSTIEGIDLLVQGRVVSLPAQTTRGQRFEFKLTDVQLMSEVNDSAESIDFTEKIRLSWYSKFQPVVEAGTSYQLLVRLKRPHGLVNPAGFDYERWLFARGVGATGYVKNSTYNRMITNGSQDFLYRFSRLSVNGIRQRLQTFIVDAVDDSTIASVLLALGIGDQQLLDRSDHELLQKMGLSHLMAISGLHIGLAAGFGMWLGKGIGRVLNLLAPSIFFTPTIAPIVSLLAAFMYALLAGFSLPTQRAFVMLLVWVSLYISGRRYSVWLPWWVSMALILLWQPLAHLERGFWLSFIAVAVLINTFQSDWLKNQTWLQALVKAQLILFVSLGILQWTLGLPVSLVSPLINLLAIPYVGFIMVPVLLVALCLVGVDQSWAVFALNIAVFGTDMFWTSLLFVDQYIGQMNGWDVLLLNRSSSPSNIMLLIGAGCLVICLLPVFWMTRLIASLAVVCCLNPSKIQHHGLSVMVFDVGQGLAMALHLHNQTWLYDLGYRSSNGFSTAISVILPYLRSKGITDLDKVFISHADGDHVGGVNDIVTALPVQEWYWGEPRRTQVLTRQFVSAHNCDSDKHWLIKDQVNQAGIDVWLLGIKPLAVDKLSGNNLSCVLLLSYGDTQILLTGDIEAEREQQLLEHPRLKHPLLKDGVDVLMVPHHGSKTSSTPYFLNKLSPDLAVVSAGYLSRYGHPSSTVVTRYQQRDIDLVNTAQHGSVLIDVDAEQGWQARSYRLISRRYWRSE